MTVRNGIQLCSTKLAVSVTEQFGNLAFFSPIHKDSHLLDEVGLQTSEPWSSLRVP